MPTPFEHLQSLNRLVHEPARLAILVALSACDKADFLFLLNITGLTKGNLSSHLSKLEQAGLVARSPHPTDGRTTLIELTAEGRTLAKRSTAALNTEVFGKSGFADEDVEHLLRVLGDFRKAAGDFTD